MWIREGKVEEVVTESVISKLNWRSGAASYGV